MVREGPPQPAPYTAEEMRRDRALASWGRPTILVAVVVAIAIIALALAIWG